MTHERYDRSSTSLRRFSDSRFHDLESDQDRSVSQSKFGQLETFGTIISPDLDGLLSDLPGTARVTGRRGRQDCDQRRLGLDFLFSHHPP